MCSSFPSSAFYLAFHAVLLMIVYKVNPMGGKYLAPCMNLHAVYLLLPTMSSSSFNRKCSELSNSFITSDRKISSV